MDHEVQTRQQFWGDFEQKWAEATGTAVMPHGVDNGPQAKAKTVIQKTASVDPRVDVTGKEPPTEHKRKEAQHYALPSQRKYPIDSYSDVEKAASYYAQWSGHFSPRDRHEYCSNLVKRASALGLEVSEEIGKYGSATYAPESELQIALEGRRGLVSEQHAVLLDKVAERRIDTEPELFAELLSEFDKTAGIDHLYDSDILDPYYSTFGVKLAAKDDPDGSFLVGNDYVTHTSLRELGNRATVELGKIFGADFVKEFGKDPIGIFSSLPIDQKKIISRLASTSASNA